jgi:DNA-binding PadR family transcriptional regulator
VSAVFSHGRLRLYLLKLLDEGSRHGYELIRLLENRFHGLYAPSAGTIYPRLARMEADGLITHTASGGRKVYEITDLGRAELQRRSAEVDELESEIHASVADLADLAEEIEAGVRGSVRDLKRELRQATRDARGSILDGIPGVEDWTEWRDAWRGPDASGRRSAGDREQPAATGTSGTGPSAAGSSAAGLGPRAAEVERKAAELAEEVSRLIALGRASDSDLRVAGTVLDSIRRKLRHILRG